MEAIEINSTNFQDYLGLDLVAFSLAHAGAMGEGGAIMLLTSEGILYHTNIIRSLKLEQAFYVCPPLKDCYFSPINTVVPKGWTHLYMGGGNFLVVNNNYKDIVLKSEPNKLYNQWINILVDVIKQKN